MGASTIYDVQVRYMLEDRASAHAARMSRGFREAAHHADALSGALGHIGTAIAGYVGIHQAYEAFVGFNSEVEQTKIGLSAIIALELNKSFASASTQADKLFEEFQRFAMVTPLTTQEIHEFSKSISGAVFGAGGSMKDFIALSEQGAVAAKTLFGDTALGAMQMTEMLNGTVRRTERFTMLLLNTMHISIEKWREMTGRERMDSMEKLFGSEAMQSMNKRSADSFAGVTSSFKDLLQIINGKIGMGIFKAITKEIQSWNTWILANQKTIEGWSHSVSDGLMAGFNGVKEVFRFIVDNKELLLDIAKAWLVGKGIGGIISGVGGMFGAFTGGLSSATNALATLAVATVAIADQWGESKLKDNLKNDNLAMMGKIAYQANWKGDAQQINMLRSYAKEAGILDAHGGVNEKKAWGMIGASSAEDARKQHDDLNGFFSFLDNQAAEYSDKINAVNLVLTALKTTVVDTNSAFKVFGTLKDGFLAAAGVLPNLLGRIPGGPSAQRPQVNVTIQHIEVKSEDPDRIAFGLVDSFMDMAQNPSGAKLRRFRGG